MPPPSDLGLFGLWLAGSGSASRGNGSRGGGADRLGFSGRSCSAHERAEDTRAGVLVPASGVEYIDSGRPNRAGTERESAS